MHNLPALTLVTGKHISHQESVSNLNETAQNAREYALELLNEFGALSGLMAKNHPEAAARFSGLISELISATSVTASRAKKLADGLNYERNSRPEENL